MHGAAIVDAVIGEGGFSVSDTGIARATVTGWCHAAYLTMVTRSRWALSIASLGTTVAGTSTYTLADTIIDVEAVRVGTSGRNLPRVGTETIWDLQASDQTLISPTSQVWAPSFDSAGVSQIFLFPAPTTSGDTIYGLVASLPSAFTDSSGFTPAVPEDFHRALVWGGIAEGYAVSEEALGEAADWLGRFDAKVEELRRRKNSRVGGNTIMSVRRR